DPRLSHRLWALLHLHVYRAGGAVRIVYPPGDSSAGVAAEFAVRANFADRNRPGAEYVHASRAVGAFRNGEEELDTADRSHQWAETKGYGTARSSGPGEPRPATSDPDDHNRICCWNDAACIKQRSRFRHQPLNFSGGYRRTVIVFAAYAGGHACGVFDIRR